MAKTRVDYHEYMASREWALKKEAVKARSGGICERCCYGSHENTHHLTYERLGDERLEDLLGICRPCHEFSSAKRKEDPAYPCRGDLGAFHYLYKNHDMRLEQLNDGLHGVRVIGHYGDVYGILVAETNTLLLRDGGMAVCEGDIVIHNATYCWAGIDAGAD